MKAKITGLFIIAIVFLVLACSDDKKEEVEVTPPPQGVEVMDITIKGDDMAKNLGDDWGGDDVDNGGSSGATIDYLLEYPDSRDLKTVILFVGINNLGNNESPEEIIPKYIKLYSSLDAERIFCVGVPPVYGEAPYDSTLWMNIWTLNDAIKVICSESNYIDTWKITFTSTDDIHPDATMNALIKDKITALQ